MLRSGMHTELTYSVSISQFQLCIFVFRYFTVACIQQVIADYGQSCNDDTECLTGEWCAADIGEYEQRKRSAHAEAQYMMYGSNYIEVVARIAY